MFARSPGDIGAPQIGAAQAEQQAKKLRESFLQSEKVPIFSSRRPLQKGPSKAKDLHIDCTAYGVIPAWEMLGAAPQKKKCRTGPFGFLVGTKDPISFLEIDRSSLVHSKPRTCQRNFADPCFSYQEQQPAMSHQPLHPALGDATNGSNVFKGRPDDTTRKFFRKLC